MKVIAIEDDEVQHKLIGAIFDRIGIDALFCSTGEEGLQKLNNHHFDAVMLDMGLPGKSSEKRGGPPGPAATAHCRRIGSGRLWPCLARASG